MTFKIIKNASFFNMVKLNFKSKSYSGYFMPSHLADPITFITLIHLNSFNTIVNYLLFTSIFFFFFLNPFKGEIYIKSQNHLILLFILLLNSWFRIIPLVLLWFCFRLIFRSLIDIMLIMVVIHLLFIRMVFLFILRFVLLLLFLNIKLFLLLEILIIRIFFFVLNFVFWLLKLTSLFLEISRVFLSS